MNKNACRRTEYVCVCKCSAYLGFHPAVVMRHEVANVSSCTIILYHMAQLSITYGGGEKGGGVASLQSQYPTPEGAHRTREGSM